MDALQNFKELFWDAFHRPALSSQHLIAVWEHLETINDQLAGPFYAIYENGNCNYIFNDKDRFPDINDPDDFLNWCIALVDTYKNEIESFIPTNEEEIVDKKVLLFQTDIKMELADLAYLIIKEKSLQV